MEKRKDIVDELLERLDATCSLILAKLTLNPKGMGFNELHRKIREHHKEMAKSTLSEHLKHLMGMGLVENEPVKDSPLKFKPSKYRVSKYFRDLSKGFIAQSTTPEDYLPFMKSEDVTLVTNHLMFFILQHVTKSLKTSLQAPENISIWNMHQAFYNIETLMRAYRQRVLEGKEESEALKALQESLSNLSETLRAS